jgi:hypothetical protein
MSTGDDATCYVVGRPPPRGQTSPQEHPCHGGPMSRDTGPQAAAVEFNDGHEMPDPALLRRIAADMHCQAIRVGSPGLTAPA